MLQSEEDLPSVETLHWADGCLLVYAITDRRSFNYVRRVKQMLCCDTPLALVGNKGDMVHLRQVSTEEGIRRVILISNCLQCGGNHTYNLL
jgi:Ras-like protein family protein 11A